MSKLQNQASLWFMYNVLLLAQHCPGTQLCPAHWVCKCTTDHGTVSRSGTSAALCTETPPALPTFWGQGTVLGLWQVRETPRPRALPARQGGEGPGQPRDGPAMLSCEVCYTGLPEHSAPCFPRSPGPRPAAPGPHPPSGEGERNRFARGRDVVRLHRVLSSLWRRLSAGAGTRHAARSAA